MRAVRHLRPADYRRLPWRNGRGVTVELALWPRAAAFERNDFTWRVSTAAIESGGPCSCFPAFERILVVTHGEGLVLEHAGAAPRARLRRLEPYRFDGAWATSAELVRGPAADFNVLFRRDLADAQVEALQLGRRSVREAVEATHLLVHVLSGSLSARVTGEEEPEELGASESLWLCEARASDEVALLGTAEACVALVVRITLPASLR